MSVPSPRLRLNDLGFAVDEIAPETTWLLFEQARQDDGLRVALDADLARGAVDPEVSGSVTSVA